MSNLPRNAIEIKKVLGKSFELKKWGKAGGRE
jgi:hypothetical protein